MIAKKGGNKIRKEARNESLNLSTLSEQLGVKSVDDWIEHCTSNSYLFLVTC